jgi:hypothetical protein
MTATDKGWLRQLGKAVVHRLATVPTIPSAMSVHPRKVRTERTNTDGWYAEVARLPTGRGDRLQIWLDKYARANRRRLYLCYKSPDPGRARLLAAAGAASVIEPRRVDDSFCTAVGSDDWRMKKPLPSDEFRRVFAEIYARKGSWSFLGIYLPQRIDPSRQPTGALLSECSEFFAQLLRSIMVHHSEAQSDVAYPEANRLKVRRHLRRERAGALAELAKIRDEHTVSGLRHQFPATLWVTWSRLLGGTSPSAVVVAACCRTNAA